MAMFYWKSKLCVILLLAFSGFNLIRSDCGADGGYCNNRRLDAPNYGKGEHFLCGLVLERSVF